MSDLLKAPFPWFGGKRRVAAEVWAAFGDVPNYVEPFFGSGAVLLGRPHAPAIETVNDLDGFVANAWRAIQYDPEGTARWADWPVNECDLHARHLWLKARRADLCSALMADPDYYDPKIAGWWLWGMACWIGSGFCGDSGGGPWIVEAGRLVKREGGITRKLPHLGDAGRGVARQLPHLGDAGQGVARQRPHLGNAGQGVARKRPILHHAGKGVNSPAWPLLEWFAALSERLRRVRVCCGDWLRVMGESVTTNNGVTGVMLDPPYADTAGRAADLYIEDSFDVAHAVREWAIANGDNPKLRIALCGYEGEHAMPVTWRKWAWKSSGGFASQRHDKDDSNARRERIWFSPHCLQPMPTLFDMALA